MPPIDLESPPEAPSANSLEYVRASSPVTRRQFRFLLFLTLLNTILLSVFICGPSVSSFIRTSWNDYQARRKLAQFQQQRAALLQTVAAYTAPSDQVVYEENPQEAAKLLNASTDYSTLPNSRNDIIYLTPQPWQPPIYRKPDPLVSQLHAAVLNPPAKEQPTILLHKLKCPSGEERLIWITLAARFQLLYEDAGGGQQFVPQGNVQVRQLRTRADRLLSVHLVQEVYGSSLVPSLDAHPRLAALLLNTFPQNTTVTWTNTGTWENGRIDVQPGGVFRLYAAQVDPADPSHFTINYAIDNQRNTIDGYLKNDNQILFVPRAGRIVRKNSDVLVWDPFAVPATRPAQ
jgi:hypothetical protein